MKSLIKAMMVAGAFACFFLTSCKKEQVETTQVTKVSPSITSMEGITTDHNPKKIRGKIRSTTSSQVIEGADVYLYDGAVLIEQAVSDENGEFEMDSIYIGAYDLEVHATGYQDNEFEITVPLAGEEYDIGDIYMEE